MLTSSGAVAFTIVTVLPVELILQVGSGAGYAMIFALLIAAINWNLGTWALGLPNSSSHALVGSIMGVGIANQLISPSGSATSGVDWAQALNVFKALLFSPVIGFAMAALLLLAMKFVVRSKSLYIAPEGKKPPPLPIRALLVLTCTGVSFFHGSNDGQKGMELIMLILIGAMPTAYALNRAIPENTKPMFLHAVQSAEESLSRARRGGGFAKGRGDCPRDGGRCAQGAQAEPARGLRRPRHADEEYCRHAEVAAIVPGQRHQGRPVKADSEVPGRKGPLSL